MDTKKLDKWADLLLDTGKRNNLINFKDTRASTVEVLLPTADALFEKIDGSTSFEVFDPKIIEEDEESEESSETEQLQIEPPEESDISSGKAAFLAQYSGKIKRQNQILLYNSATNPLNEFFAKDTSRKIRAVQKAKGERGVPLTTNVPFGYRKDPEDKTKWIVDEAAAMVVRRIFMLCMEGRGPMQIAKLLQEEKVLNPTAYKRQIGIKTPSPETADPYHWNTNTVVHILERREYTGCTVNFKTYTNSIWDKKQRETPLENQAVFYDTHPAIIEQEVFDKVQEIRQQRHRRTKTGKSSLFSGMVYCADCGAKMRYCTTNYFEKRQDHFVCANYRSNTGSCSAHFIRAVVLEDLVWMHMKAVIFYVTRYEAHFRAVMEHKLLLSSEEKICASIKRLEQAQRRMGELDRLFIRIYEDNVAGRINDERFSMMSRNYETEQEQLKGEIQTLQQDIEVQERQIENLEQFIQRVHKYKDLDELTPYALRELVKGVYIEAPDKSSGKRRQNIRISYDLVGFIPLSELMKEETA